MSPQRTVLHWFRGVFGMVLACVLLVWEGFGVVSAGCLRVLVGFGGLWSQAHLVGWVEAGRPRPELAGSLSVLHNAGHAFS